MTETRFDINNFDPKEKYFRHTRHENLKPGNHRYFLHRHNGLHLIYTDNLVHKRKPDSSIGLVIPAQHHRTDDW